MGMTPDEFTAQYHIEPQVYATRTAVAAALGARVPEAIAAFHDAKAALDAFGNPDVINAGSDQAAIQALATASNFLAAKREELLAWETSQSNARAFADGAIDWSTAFGGNAMLNIAVGTGEVDEDAVRTAIQDALA